MDDLLPAYVALIRHELGAPAGSDALEELRTRLEPADRSKRPASRAPGIARLRRGLRRLEAGETPGSTLE
ncbi:MAG: hypothetical protein HY873_05190, partial [Chloroflexi bacterium]|nr:hypothetical protein [Chloroflexota bacterium]